MTTKLRAASFQDGAVTTAKIAADAVTAAKLADNSVVTANISDGAVTQVKTTSVGQGKNIIVNGAMQVAQRATTANTTGSGVFTVDRMALGIDSLGTWATQQESLTSGAAYNAGFRKAFRIDCSVADASPASSDNIFFQYKIEGQDLNAFKKGTSAAEQFTLQFWVKSNKTGTGQVLLIDADNSRAVGKTYTISSANTWEQKILTFPADTTGSFDHDNAKSLEIEWALDAGSDFTSGTLPETWTSSSNQIRSVNDFALGDSTDNDWAITGIQLEVGALATDFEHKTFAEDLHLCKRYFQQFGGNSGYATVAHVYAASTQELACDFRFSPPMRATPSISWHSAGQSMTYRYQNNASQNFSRNSLNSDGNIGQLRSDGGSVWFAGWTHSVSGSAAGEIRVNNGHNFVKFTSEL